MKLKPCPFCGDDQQPRLDDRGEAANIECPCGAMGPTGYGLDSHEKAIKAWNKRSDTDDPK
jgi:Lar family restriction alleviation protein